MALMRTTLLLSLVMMWFIASPWSRVSADNEYLDHDFDEHEPDDEDFFHEDHDRDHDVHEPADEDHSHEQRDLDQQKARDEDHFPEVPDGIMLEDTAEPIEEGKQRNPRLRT
ncbi:uncharacterized protein [Littorina saxatilis]|uniref:Secreted protein n=1 Tax=Littorina saxatilis TaxID=31220 RepID=A0AAN9C3R9_9CAEN